MMNCESGTQKPAREALAPLHDRKIIAKNHVMQPHGTAGSVVRQHVVEADLRGHLKGRLGIRCRTVTSCGEAWLHALPQEDSTLHRMQESRNPDWASRRSNKDR
jgi:hypothetical protein